MHRRKFIKKLLIFSTLFITTLSQSFSNNYTLFSKKLKRKYFKKQFTWGAACASFQVEGGWDADGKSPSIWDTFSHLPRKNSNGENANIACDFYNKYESDILLIKQFGFDSFRFSLAWNRILPFGKNNVNNKGLDFYHRVIDCCLKNDITPWVTLYHWDLPQTLEDNGGWCNRDILDRFADYANVCSREFGEKVKNWMVLNEPMTFVGLGYGTGYHAPGKRGLKSFLSATHHAALCQAIGGRIIRQNVANANIGTTFSCSVVNPLNNKELHSKAALRVDTLLNRLFIEPALGLGYPVADLPLLEGIDRYFKNDDLEQLKFDFDFIGLQYYFRVVVKHSLLIPYINAREIKPKKRDAHVNDLGLEVYPRGMYEMIKKFSNYQGVKNIIITENGVCYPDYLIDGKVIDKERIRFFKDHLYYVQKARKKGLPVNGYFVWSATDNFEWAEGYKPRFGLIYIDYPTQTRIVKESGFWWKYFLEKRNEQYY